MPDTTNPHATRHAASAAALRAIRDYLADPVHWGVQFDAPFPRAERGDRLTLPEAVRQFSTPDSNPGEWLGLALWQHDPARTSRRGTLFRSLDAYNEAAGHAGVLALLDTAAALADKDQPVPPQPPAATGDLLTTTQAAAALGISRRRLRDLIAAGRLPVVRAGSLNLIRPADLALVQDRQPGRPGWQPKPAP